MWPFEKEVVEDICVSRERVYTCDICNKHFLRNSFDTETDNRCDDCSRKLVSKHIADKMCMDEREIGWLIKRLI